MYQTLNPPQTSTKKQGHSKCLAGKTNLKCLALCEGMYATYIIIPSDILLSISGCSGDIKGVKEEWRHLGVSCN